MSISITTIQNVADPHEAGPADNLESKRGMAPKGGTLWLLEIHYKSTDMLISSD